MFTKKGAARLGLAVLGTGATGLTIRNQLESHREFVASHEEAKKDRLCNGLKPEHLHPGKIDNLSPAQKYPLSVATRYLFENPTLGEAGFVHTAIAIQVSDEECLILGRHLASLVNEKYHFAGRTPFKVPVGSDLPKVTIEELKAGAMYTEKEVCNTQSYDLLRSNCSTAAYVFLAGVKQAVMKRKDSPEKTETIKKLEKELAETATLNYGVGLTDNPAVEKLSPAKKLTAAPAKKAS